MVYVQAGRRVYAVQALVEAAHVEEEEQLARQPDGGRADGVRRNEGGGELKEKRRA